MADNKELIDLIEKKFTETNKNIESIQSQIQTDISTFRVDLDGLKKRIELIETESNEAHDRINDVCLQIELLKQERLRNNIRFTGLPPNAFDDPIHTVMSIDEVLKIDLIPSDFTAYADRHKSSLIVSFASHAHKRLLTNTLQQRKSLLVEEIFPSIKSNSNVYANDQLTPYFAKLFQAAWKAKKDGSIFSASSLGGRIKVKLHETSQPVLIETEDQLIDLMNETQQPNGQADSRGNDNRNTNLLNQNEDSGQQQAHPNNSNNRQGQANKSASQSKHITARGFNRADTRNSRRRWQLDQQQRRSDSKNRAYRADFNFDDRTSTAAAPHSSTHSQSQHKAYRHAQSSSTGRYVRQRTN